MFRKVLVNRCTTIGRIHERRIKHMYTQLLQDLFSEVHTYSPAPNGNGISWLDGNFSDTSVYQVN